MEERSTFPDVAALTYVLTPDQLEHSRKMYVITIRNTLEGAVGAKGSMDVLDLIKYADELHKMPIRQRLMHLMLNPAAWKAAREKLGKLAQHLDIATVAVLGDVTADFHQLAAETADCLLRIPSDSDPGLPNLIGEQCREVLGIRQSGDVEWYYDKAYMLYGLHFLQTITDARKSHGDDNDPRTHMVAILDQLAVKHVAMATRLQLLHLERLLRQVNPSLTLRVASSDEILPHLKRLPQLQDSLSPSLRLSLTYQVIRSMSVSLFNDRLSVIAFHTNTALLATILGKYRNARKSLRIAVEFAGDRPPDELSRLGTLIDLLNA